MKMPNFGPRNTLVGYFWAGTWKQYYYIWDQQHQICLIAKFREKAKISKFGSKNAMNKNALMIILTKNVLLGYFWAWIWKRHVVICEISVLEFALLQSLVQKFKSLNLTPKCLFWVFYLFWSGIWKQYSHIWNQHPRICLIVKIRKKTKVSKFGLKMPYF